jgi:hypothetical protein
VLIQEPRQDQKPEPGQDQEPELEQDQEPEEEPELEHELELELVSGARRKPPASGSARELLTLLGSRRRGS